MTELHKLLNECGLTSSSGSKLLGIEYNRFRNMIYGKVKTPPEALNRLEKLHTEMQNIFK